MPYIDHDDEETRKRKKRENEEISAKVWAQNKDFLRNRYGTRSAPTEAFGERDKRIGMALERESRDKRYGIGRHTSIFGGSDYHIGIEGTRTDYDRSGRVVSKVDIYGKRTTYDRNGNKVAESQELSPEDQLKIAASMAYLMAPLLIGFLLSQKLSLNLYQALIVIWAVPVVIVSLLYYAHAKAWPGFRQEAIVGICALLIAGAGVLVTIGWILG